MSPQIPSDISETEVDASGQPFDLAICPGGSGSSLVCTRRKLTHGETESAS